MVDPEARLERVGATEKPFAGRHDVMIERVPLGSALRLCGLFLGVWMFGDWVDDLRAPVLGLHTAGGMIAACGCVLFMVSSYVVVRGWQLRHRR
jgi:hypothetical protein